MQVLEVGLGVVVELAGVREVVGALVGLDGVPGQRAELAVDLAEVEAEVLQARLNPRGLIDGVEVTQVDVVDLFVSALAGVEGELARARVGGDLLVDVAVRVGRVCQSSSISSVMTPSSCVRSRGRMSESS